MDFYAILDQVIAVLRQRQRVTYRALKRQFNFDDDYLEDVKAELIQGQRLAVDEDGAVLVWTGGTDVAPHTTPPDSLSGVPPGIAGAPSPPSLPAPAAPPSSDAERRQLTVMFCDLVDSTKLSSQLDPEDWRDVVRAYQQVCTDVIQRYDGHIAQLLGDGLLIYFGYPHAHEDDAQRAVRTGLGILAAMGDLNTHLQQAKGIQLALRMGIHTGLVVVGAMGGAGRQEQLALGEVPNVCSRIQGLAASNTIAMSEATYRLVRGYVDCQDLGEQTLRGVSEPLHVYRVLQESGARGRLDVAQTRGLTPLVGRESEVTLLLERWEQVKAGQGQVVLLSGDAGIGKSRLVQMLKEHIAQEPHTRWECRSSEYYQNTALFPLVDLFQRLLQFQAEDTADAKFGKLEHALSQYGLPLEESVQLFAPLLSVPLPEHHYSPLNLSPQRQRQKTLETIVAILLELAGRQPLLFILEDLHWTDPTTLELLNLLIDQTPTASMLVLLTCRPTFQPSWSHKSYLSEVTVNRLSHAQVAQIVTCVTGGKTLPTEVLQQILTKTDGVPLFVEELTKAILESGQLKETDGHYELAGSLQALVIPATLQDSLMARLDRLMTAKVIAQLGATIGRQFSYALLHAVAQLDGVVLQHELGRLVDAEIVYHRGLPPQATYTFKHALIQDTAYQSLLRSTRQQYHQCIARVLEARFPETTETQPELLAHHFTEAGLNEQAVGYWQRAGQKAIHRSANVEAIALLRKGLEQLQPLPETSVRALQELTLQRTLGVPLLATKGFAAPEVEHAYTRARALCQHISDVSHLFPILFGLWGFYEVKGDLQTAREVAEQLRSLAQHQHDPALVLQGHRALGDTLYCLGEFVAARTHLEQGIALYDRHQHRPHAFLYGQDPGMGCLVFAALTLWYLGLPDQAVQRSHEALTLMGDLSHPFSLVFALNYTAHLCMLRREWHAMQEYAEAAIVLAAAQNFAQWAASGTWRRGFALVKQGHEEGMALMEQGVTMRRATGASERPFFLLAHAEVAQARGRNVEGLQILADALALVDKTGERNTEAELHRLKGELLLAQSPDNHTEAEACFQHAIRIAQSQQAKSWELRASTSLARLWQQQGKHQEAHDLLAPIYSWFTEGFDTADLQEAKALLDALA